ncbi:MocR-like pyridoxine biosynthesis transcription factor PdxR [Brevibacillus centrosporus]|uniref:GntR family transcriptional regulator / MocR family aminotransferase n=1 Tax=Brevibacillus centrosporus TaxID=54910 RepID=A0A1I3ZIP3_9BACL|nr:PLP-dependent aminotransferase family protein [Brevibacillus centrosporus]SFK43790.1 GntR family transcriptional regulator / MocR family aminotransferase [Brevibacillus centrosporus]
MLLTPTWDENGNEPQYVQLYAYIKNEIVAGRLAEQTRLPSVRKLADLLGLSTTPVEMAYQQLQAEGFILSRHRSGYFVEELPDPEVKPGAGTGFEGPVGIQRPLIRDGRNYEYDFHMSQNDFSLFPHTVWRRLYNQTLRLEQQEDLFYGDPQGEPGLRLQIADYLRRYRGVVCSPDQIVIGADQFGLLSLTSLMLKPQHQRFGVENPGYLLYANTFRQHGFEAVPISLQEDGINVSELYESGVQLLAVSPSHQYPRGMIMPISKRLQLLEWARNVNGYIIEDDYDGEFRYHGRPIPSLQGLMPHTNVIYLGGFAQVMAPALCVWYMVLPESLIGVYYELLRETLLEQSSSRLHQRTLQTFMEQGYLEKHVRKMRNVYRKKHDLLAQAVQEHFGDRAVMIGKDAGFHVLLRVDTSRSEKELNKLAIQAGVRASPASFTWLQPPKEMPKEFFLGFAGIPIEKIGPGIKALHEAWFG